mgnify:CR=1 FL=1
MKENRVVALAGQPNCGKSTIFNMLTGARQYVANYPGVTVDIKRGFLRSGAGAIEIVDLPGAYSLTSYSSEEMVTRDFILNDAPDVVLNVIDASNLKRSLCLTFQILEMEAPLIVDLNMTDVAAGRGMSIDAKVLSRELGVPVASTVGNRRKGGRELKTLLEAVPKGSREFRLDYGTLEQDLLETEVELGTIFHEQTLPWRWMALKLFEKDDSVCTRVASIGERGVALLKEVERRAKEFEKKEKDDPASHIGYVRHLRAEEIERASVVRTPGANRDLTDRIDSVVVNRFFGPVLLLGIIYALYELSIVWGYKLTEYVVPWLNRFQMSVEGYLPVAGFWQSPMLRSLVGDVLTSINSVLIYIPIFLILFACIAFLEDVGYMPRMAFILDRVFRRFGLHGQSTLPLILGGIFIGGCAVPGVMATRVIADDRARFATILVVPLMNCMAKIPLYTLLISIYFVGSEGGMMLFISSITIVAALAVAKVLSLTVLRQRPSSPFVMEMPPYHMPTVHGIASRSIERTWLFCKKILSVIMLVSVAVFFLTNYPGLPEESVRGYERKAADIRAGFLREIEGTSYAKTLRDEDAFLRYLDMSDRFRQSRLAGADAESLVKRFSAEDATLASMMAGKGDEFRKLDKAAKKLRNGRLSLIRDASSERLNGSVLGRIAAFLEPATRFAGFNRKVNVALLSSLAAKESSVATLGVLYQPQDDAGKTLGERMKEQERGFTPLHALALMVFMAFYPPCVATLLMVRVETRSWLWSLFALVYPTALGLGCASLIYSGGKALGLTGLPAAWAFFGLLGAVALLLGMIPSANIEDEADGVVFERR